jgi:cohesin complex subunit SA-1/2
MLSNIVHRGKYEPQEDEIDDLEDEIVTFAIKAAQFYFMWKTRSIAKLLASGTGMSDAALDTLSVLRQSYRRHLIETFSSRAAIDQLRLFATGSLCDLHFTFATLRPSIKNFHPSSEAATNRGEKLKVLLQEIEPGLVPELISIFDGAERQYAKKSKKDKVLNDPAEDEDPMADDEELDEDDEDEDLSKEELYTAELKAERALCELTAKYVLALSASLIDDRGSQASKLRRRMMRNETKLGHNFKEIVAHLDEDKMAKRHRKPAKQPSKSDKLALSTEVITGEEEEDEDNMFDDAEPEEDSRDDLLRRELVEDDIIDEGEEQADDGVHNDVDDDGLGD